MNKKQLKKQQEPVAIPIDYCNIKVEGYAQSEEYHHTVPEIKLLFMNLFVTR